MSKYTYMYIYIYIYIHMSIIVLGVLDVPMQTCMLTQVRAILHVGVILIKSKSCV